MGFYDSYKLVFDRVREKIDAVADIKRTVLGERFRLTRLPMAIINPTTTRIEQLAIGSPLKATVSFNIILVIRETEPKDWFDEIISLMGKCLDAIVADRSFGGACKDVIPVAFNPGEIRFAEKIYYGGLVGFEALLHYAP